MFGTASIEHFFALEILRIKRELNVDRVRVLSLGSGECSLEVGVAKILTYHGAPYSFCCTDISPSMIVAGEACAAREGLRANFEFRLCDINKDFPSGPWDVVVANHCLHHFIELEFIFDRIREELGGGAFVISDMIGRNGHMRWPETLTFVEAFWNMLPPEKRVDRINRIARTNFVNYDCAAGTLEGVRAQDILPLLLGRFEFERFLGYGGLPDIFVDRMYGGNFDAESPADQAFIDALELVNSALMSSGQIKPTMMFATVRAESTTCVFDPLHPLGAVRPYQ